MGIKASESVWWGHEAEIGGRGESAKGREEECGPHGKDVWEDDGEWRWSVEEGGEKAIGGRW